MALESGRLESVKDKYKDQCEAEDAAKLDALNKAKAKELKGRVKTKSK